MPVLELKAPMASVSAGGEEQLTADVLYEVDPQNGSDVTGDGSVGNPLATVAHALSLIPKNLGGFRAYIAPVATAVITETIEIEGYHSGELFIGGDEDAVWQAQFPLTFKNNSAYICVLYLTFHITANGGTAVRNYNSFVYLEWCYVSKEAAATNTRVYFGSSGSFGYIDDMWERSGFSKVDYLFYADSAAVIHYNGTNAGVTAIKHPSATGLFYRSGAGMLEPVGHIVLSAKDGWPSLTSGCAALAQWETTTNKLVVNSLDFDAVTKEYAEWTWTMPADYHGGTITAVFYWTAASGSGSVRWGLQGVALFDGYEIDTAFGTAQEVTDTLQSTAKVHSSSPTAAITLGGFPFSGALVQLRAYRDPENAADTLGVDARLLAIRLTYTRE